MKWKIFLATALLAGLLLRTVHVRDMEYKEDEEYDYTVSQTVGRSQSWPWIGMPSGVYVPNPGMSVWSFAALARISGAKQPTELARALQIFSWLGIALIIPFALWFVKESERKLWLWGCALAMVNPFAILYERKLWPEPFLPFFIVLMLMGFWKREKWQWAFLWGWIGAWLGQIHMSGFFFAAGIALWTALFDRKRPSWWGWFWGSTFGALPLIPWVWFVIMHPTPQRISMGWDELLQFKFWAFWFTDPTGLHLGNPLGLLRSQVSLKQIEDFVRYPLIEGHATYICGIAHLTAALVFVTALFQGLAQLIRTTLQHKLAQTLIGRNSETLFAQNAAFFGFGVLMSATRIVIRRYYMVVTFPLEFVFLVRMVKATSQKCARFLLATLWVSELLISACFVHYVHVNQGATQGDYGDAYHVVMKKRSH